MDYTATPDSTLGDRIHVNLFDDQGNVVFEQWHDQTEWDADQGQTVTAQMVTQYESAHAPQEQAVPIPINAKVSVKLSSEQASAQIAVLTAAPSQQLGVQQIKGEN